MGHAPACPYLRLNYRIVLRVRGCGLGRFHLRGLGLLPVSLRLILFALGAAHFDATLYYGAIFHADAYCSYVSGDLAFAADVHAIAAFNIPADLAHHDYFAGNNVRLHAAVAANGDAVLRHGDLAFDAAIVIK